MLRFFNQRTGIQKAILWSFVGILVLGLGVVFALPSGRSMLRSYAPIGASTVVASVDGYAITLSDLRGQIKALGRTQQFSGGKMPNEEPDIDSLYPQYGKQAVDTLVNARLVRREADRLSLGASTDEIRDYILSTFTDPKTGKWIGEAEYQTRLRMAGYSVEAFERDISDQLAEAKLRSFLTGGLAVSDREIEEDYRRSGTTLKPTYVLVAPKPDEVPPASEEELRAYYDGHKGDFRISVPQRKVAYLFVSQDALGKTLEVSDEELQQAYEQKKDVAAVHVAQIVFKIAKPEQDADVRKKAEAVAGRARQQGDKAPEDFAELAKQNSEDPATAANGGDAGFIEKSTLKPGDPRERLFSLKKDQTTSAIKVGDTYVVYKVIETREKSLEESRQDLLTGIRQQKAYSKGVEIAQQAQEKLKAEKDPQKVANDLNAALGAPADALAVTVRETPYMQPGEQLPDIGSNPQFDAEVSDLVNVGDVGETVGVTGGFAVPMLADKRDPHDATFEESRDRVATAYRQNVAKQRARDIAQQLATAATSPDDLRTRAKAVGLDAKTQESFKAGGTLPELQPSDLIDTALLALPANSVSKAALEMPNGFIVLATADRTEPEMGAAFDLAKPSIRDRLLATKQGQLYTEYMKNVRKQLEEAGLITIYQDTIDRAFAIGGESGEEDEGEGEGGVPTMPPAGAPRPMSGPGGRPVPQSAPMPKPMPPPPGSAPAPAPPSGKAPAPPAKTPPPAKKP